MTLSRLEHVAAMLMQGYISGTKGLADPDFCIPRSVVLAQRLLDECDKQDPYYELNKLRRERDLKKDIERAAKRLQEMKDLE